jgi:hypothetical protein
MLDVSVHTQPTDDVSEGQPTAADSKDSTAGRSLLGANHGGQGSYGNRGGHYDYSEFLLAGLRAALLLPMRAEPIVLTVARHIRQKDLAGANMAKHGHCQCMFPIGFHSGPGKLCRHTSQTPEVTISQITLLTVPLQFPMVTTTTRSGTSPATATMVDTEATATVVVTVTGAASSWHC